MHEGLHMSVHILNENTSVQQRMAMNLLIVLYCQSRRHLHDNIFM